MSSFCLLTSIPRELFHHLLQYLTYFDLSKLDLSFFNHTLRPIYLNALNDAAVESLCIYSPLCNYSETCLPWLISRKIKIRHLGIYAHSPDLITYQYIKLCSSQLRSLTITCNASNVLPYDTRFPSLEYFSLRDDNIDEVKLIHFFECNPQIITVKLQCRPDYTPNICRQISHLSNLKHLDLSHNLWFTDDHLLALLEEKHGNLLFLRLLHCGWDPDDDSLRLIVNSCPHLYCLIVGCDSFPYDVLKHLYRNISASLDHDDPGIQTLGIDCLVKNEIFVLHIYLFLVNSCVG